jgi:hypothetical protein
MNQQTRQHPDYGFLIGLLTGTMAGVWAASWLAPRVVSDLRHRRDEVADSVVRGAREVERFATAVKSDAVTPHAL